MANTWFRMYSDFLNDPKLISLAFEDQRHFIAILALKSDGTVDQDCDIKLLDRIVSQRLWIDFSIINDVKKRLVESGLINDLWQPLAWDIYKPKNDRPESHIWKVIRTEIFKRDDYTCQYCGERGGKIECDHVIPVSKGGDHKKTNLVTACFKCNRSKRNKLVEEWRRA